jgi:predicted metal-binding membrane protein
MIAQHMSGMPWVRMPGQTWLGAAASFLAMWVAMTVAMMLPSVAPELWRYRQTVGRLSVLVGAGYIFVWMVVGAVVFPLGVALAAVERQLPALARAAPIATGAVVLMAGALQFTAWKADLLTHFRQTPSRCCALPTDAGSAWRRGVHLGVHCGQCCFGLMAISLAVGVMDLRVMTVVTAAITAERIAPAGTLVARTTGVVAIGAGLCLIARSAGLA